MAKTVFPDIETACIAMSKSIEKYLIADGIDWMVGVLKTNIIRSVYGRKPSDYYDRTDAFKNSVRGRLTLNMKIGMTYNYVMMAMADPSMQEPKHTSWANGETSYKGMNVNEHLNDWLNYGHGGMGVKYRPAKFMEKTEQIIKDPKGLIRGLHAHLRRDGFIIVPNGNDLE